MSSFGRFVGSVNESDDSDDPNEGSSRSAGKQPQFQRPGKDSGKRSFKRLKGNKGQQLKRDTTLLDGLQKEGDKHPEELGGSATPADAAETSHVRTDANTSTDSTMVNSTRQINPGLFTKIIPLEMEKLVDEFLKYDLDNSSNPPVCLKVVTVKFEKFIDCLPAKNRLLFDLDTSNTLSRRTTQRLSPIGVLKVYDTTIETYQQYVDKCYHELKIYEKLRTGMGKFIPELYAAGLLYDKTIKIGEMYWRLNGPFMLLEHFAKIPTFDKGDVTLELLRNEILPCFEFIHRLGVLHNDVKMDNFVFIRKGSSDKVTCKLIDFSESFETGEKKYFEREIREVYETFNIPITN